MQIRRVLMTPKINYTANIDKVGLRRLQIDRKNGRQNVCSLDLISHGKCSAIYLLSYQTIHLRNAGVHKKYDIDLVTIVNF